MRAIRLFAVGLGAGLLVAGCKDSKNPQDPQASVTSDFTTSCSSLDCTFTDHSTVSNGGTVASWKWAFGDGSTSTDKSPTHTYNVAQFDSMTVTLIAADAGGAADTVSKKVYVAPPATLHCGTGGTDACDLVLPQNVTVTVTLQSSDCHAHGDTFVLTSPIVDTLFKDGCYATVPQSFQLNGGNAFTAGTHLQAEVLSGTTSLAFPPTIYVEGAYPSWTLKFDDGEGCSPDPTCGGTEPDKNDLIIQIDATPVP